MTPPPGNPLLERAERFIDRRRLVLGLCAAVAVALIAAIPGILTGGDDGRNVRTAEFAQIHPTTTAVPPVGIVNPLDTMPAPGATPPSPTTTRPALVLGTNFKRPTPTTAAPKPAAKPAAKPGAKPPAPAPGPTPPPAGTPPPPSCQNSYDPSCGAFRWDPAPAPDQPEQVSITPSNTTVKVGEQVDFQVMISDRDNNHFVECAFSWDYNDGTVIQTTHCDPAPGSNSCPPRYGPWTPPDPQPGSEQFQGIGHHWDSPGMYTVTYTHDSRPNSCYNPYASAGSTAVTIKVIPA